MLKSDRSLGRLISRVENGRAPDRLLFRSKKTANTGTVIGVTGPAGAGKSTLSARLIRALKRRGRRIGFVGCDPSSPFSGGAFLGDRIRLRDLAGPAVFIRSMATRGALGGLPKRAEDVCRTLHSAGYNPVLIESVGVGQTDTAIRRLANPVIVVLTPDLSDPIQHAKAGLLEIADAFVINKADHPDAGRTVQNLQAALSLGGRRDTPVFQTVATRGRGVAELARWLEEGLRVPRRRPER